MKITVTAEDIAKGVRKHPCKCAVAMSLLRMGFHDVEVDPGPENFLAIEADYEKYEAPKEVCDRVAEWDSGGEMLPFEFEACPVEDDDE